LCFLIVGPFPVMIHLFFTPFHLCNLLLSISEFAITTRPPACRATCPSLMFQRLLLSPCSSFQPQSSSNDFPGFSRLKVVLEAFLLGTTPQNRDKPKNTRTSRVGDQTKTLVRIRKCFPPRQKQILWL
ncbi:hypothetical protein XENOCAPTIV_013856, partial [Xenoophorus captivus]